MRKISTYVCVTAFSALALSIAAPAKASSIAIGTLSFDVLLDADPSTAQVPGVNAFNINNFTGLFGFDPDFPVLSGLSLTGATLSFNYGIPNPNSAGIVCGGTLSADICAETVALGNIDGGPVLDLSGNPVIQLSSFASAFSATLQATLSTDTFLLADGTTFRATSTNFLALLLPGGGQTSLFAGADYLVLQVEGDIVQADPPADPGVVPEPGTLLLVGTGVATAIRARRKK
jgi:hypothetical protein